MNHDLIAQRILDRILAKVKRDYPQRNDVSMADIVACHPALIHAYDTQLRVKVHNLKYGETRSGTVSRTTGWRPALLLMHRSNQRGSSDLLGPNDRIVAVWDGRKYVSRDRIY